MRGADDGTGHGWLAAGSAPPVRADLQINLQLRAAAAAASGLVRDKNAVTVNQTNKPPRPRLDVTTEH